MSPTEPTYDYFSLPGLSQSAMKDLEVSPLRFWHLHVNPDKPERRETPEMRLGTALHCAVLEPAKFDRAYAPALDADGYPDALDTIGDIRGWLTDKGLKPKGTLKADLIQQAISFDPRVQILSELQAQHAAENAGRIILSVEDWARTRKCANALLAQPKVAALLQTGAAEVVRTARHPTTGVLLKSKVDWVNAYCDLDLKTFSQQRGKSIDDTVADAIYYEKYYRQAYLYSLIKSLQPGARPIESSRFVIPFVESSEPHEVRIKELRPGGLLWNKAKAEVEALIWLHDNYSTRFGAAPWRDEQEVSVIEDEDIRQLAYA